MIGNYIEGREFEDYLSSKTFFSFSDNVAKELTKMENITKISVIAGAYNIVVRVDVETIGNLNKVTNKIQSIRGIINTDTHVIEKEISL